MMALFCARPSIVGTILSCSLSDSSHFINRDTDKTVVGTTRPSVRIGKGDDRDTAFVKAITKARPLFFSPIHTGLDDANQIQQAHDPFHFMSVRCADEVRR